VRVAGAAGTLSPAAGIVSPAARGAAASAIGGAAWKTAARCCAAAGAAASTAATTRRDAASFMAGDPGRLSGGARRSETIRRWMRPVLTINRAGQAMSS